MRSNPHQVTFWLFGFSCFLGSVVAGAAADGFDALCIALAILSVGFFSLFTVIHLRH